MIPPILQAIFHALGPEIGPTIPYPENNPFHDRLRITTTTQIHLVYLVRERIHIRTWGLDYTDCSIITKIPIADPELITKIQQTCTQYL